MLNTKNENEINYLQICERVIFFFCVMMIYPEKRVLSDEKENLVLLYSHFVNLFLLTLKNL